MATRTKTRDTRQTSEYLRQKYELSGLQKKYDLRGQENSDKTDLINELQAKLAAKEEELKLVTTSCVERQHLIDDLLIKVQLLSTPTTVAVVEGQRELALETKTEQ